MAEDFSKEEIMSEESMVVETMAEVSATEEPTAEKITPAPTASIPPINNKSLLMGPIADMEQALADTLAHFIQYGSLEQIERILVLIDQNDFLMKLLLEEYRTNAD